jgi:hypothetical protein
MLFQAAVASEAFKIERTVSYGELAAVLAALGLPLVVFLCSWFRKKTQFKAKARKDPLAVPPSLQFMRRRAFVLEIDAGIGSCELEVTPRHTCAIQLLNVTFVEPAIRYWPRWLPGGTLFSVHTAIDSGMRVSAATMERIHPGIVQNDFDDGAGGRDVSLPHPVTWAGGKRYWLSLQTYGQKGWQGYISFAAEYDGRMRYSRVRARTKTETS